MKKIIMILMIITIIFSSISMCFASEVKMNEDQTPWYVVTNKYNATFSINNSGMANISCGLTPKATSTIDEVTMRFVVKNISGSIVFDKTYDAVWSSLRGQYISSDTYQLKKRGTYSCTITMKCYKNDDLLETITSSTLTDTY